MSVNNHSRRVSIVQATRKLQENKDNSPTHHLELRVFRTQGNKQGLQKGFLSGTELNQSLPSRAGKLTWKPYFQEINYTPCYSGQRTNLYSKKAKLILDLIKTTIQAKKYEVIYVIMFVNHTSVKISRSGYRKFQVYTLYHIIF